eukprot:TRINITY_DN4199_c0_g1_i1.p1 TRINITY_DN4199_c0_g1~~TRINITY_DN4199_c0_g1_i1.p1  ORF type:complete len:821 (-),score=238.41 TRINITY_DN4199_c0_g1_i1:109-2571(-)
MEGISKNSSFWDRQLLTHQERIGQKGITLDEVPLDVLREALRCVNEAVQIEKNKLNRKPLERFLHSKALLNGLRLIIFLHLILAYFELPNSHSWVNWTSKVSLAFEIIFLFIWGLRLFLRFVKNGRKKMFSPWTVISLLSIAATLIDILVSLYVGNLGFRITRSLRVVFLSDISSSTRRLTKMVVYTFASMVRVLSILWIVILLYTIVGIVLIQYFVPNDPYFENFLEALLNMITCLSTANFPDIMIPSFNYSSWFAIYWLSYMSICLFLGMNIVLAFGYSQFQQIATQELVNKYIVQRKKLLKAFYILDEAETRAIRTSFITKQTFFRIVTSGNPSVAEELLEELEKMTSKTVSPLNYFRLCDKFIMKRHDQWSWSSLEESVPLDYETVNKSRVNSRPPTPKKKKSSSHRSIQLDEIQIEGEVEESLISDHKWWSRDEENYRVWREISKHWITEFVVTFLILANTANAIAALEGDLSDTFWMDNLLLVVAIIEVFIRFWFTNGFRRSWNIYDFVIISLSSASKLIVELILVKVYGSSELLVNILVLMRTLRILRILSVIGKLRQLVRTITRLITLISQYAVIIMAVYYIFAQIGMAAFNGTLSKGAKELENTPYHDGDYYKLINFNSFNSTMLTLFHLMVVNNWFVTMRAVIAVKGYWAALYFVSFYQAMVGVILNLAIAFIIESVRFLTSKEDQHKEIRYNRQRLEAGMKGESWNQFSMSQLEEKILDSQLKSLTKIEVENRKSNKSIVNKKKSTARRRDVKNKGGSQESPDDIPLETVMMYDESNAISPIPLQFDEEEDSPIQELHISALSKKDRDY